MATDSEKQVSEKDKYFAEQRKLREAEMRLLSGPCITDIPPKILLKFVLKRIAQMVIAAFILDMCLVKPIAAGLISLENIIFIIFFGIIIRAVCGFAENI